MHRVAFRKLARSGSAFGVLPHSTQDLCEICRTGGVRESDLGWIHAMGRSIRPWRDRALTIRERFSHVSNEPADTIEGEYFRCDARLSHRSGRRLTSCLSDHVPKSHTPPLSCSMYLRDRAPQHCYVLSPMMHSYKKAQPCGELGNPWFHSDYALGPKTLDGSLRRNLPESPNAFVPHSRGIGRPSMGGAIVS